MQAAVLAGGTLAAWLALGFREAPIYWDPAYFTYMGQAILRGESIYANTFMPYPPLGPLASAASMAVGRWFGLPTYLAPRYLAVAVGVFDVLLVYLVARRATASPWAGLLAGVALAGFQHLAASSLSTLEPKHLVVLFTLAASAASQRRRWSLAGCAALLAASCYQPALVLLLAFGAVAWWNGGRKGSGSLAAYAVGLGVGALPTALYLAATDAWGDFWLRSVTVQAATRLQSLGSSPGHWIHVAARFYTGDLLFFWAAALGWVWYAIESLLRGPRGALRVWLDPEWAGMPLLAALLAASASIEFEGYPDMYPLLPVVAFWAAWFAHRAVEFVANSAQHLRGPAGGRARPVLGLALVLLACICAFRDVPGHVHRFTLEQQRAIISRITGRPQNTVMAFSAEEVYVLSERPSPNPFLRLPRIFVPLLPSVGLRSCNEVSARVLEQRPRAVAVRLLFLAGGCEPGLGKRLVAHGYRREKTRLGIVVYWSPDPAGARNQARPGTSQAEAPSSTFEGTSRRGPR